MTIISIAVVKNPWRKWDSPHSQQESEMQYLGMLLVCFQSKPFNITVIQVYAPTTNTEESEFEWFYQDLQDLLELTLQKDVRFITDKWNAKGESQKIPASNKQV